MSVFGCFFNEAVEKTEQARQNKYDGGKGQEGSPTEEEADLSENAVGGNHSH